MHGDTLDHIVKRLNSPPMNIDKVYIPLMNVALHIARVELPAPKEGIRFGRRVKTIMEIKDFEDYKQISYWDPNKDTFKIDIEGSEMFKQIAKNKGVTIDYLVEEVKSRAAYLNQLVQDDIRDQRQVANKVLTYYEDKRGEELYARSKMNYVKSYRKLRNGKKITVWRYPKGAIDPKTGKNIGGRVVRDEKRL